MRSPRMILAGLALLLAALSSGCSDDTSAPASDGMEGMEGMDMSSMNDPDATPADELAGAETSTGQFTVLETAPPGSEGVSGQAWLAQNDNGTTVTIRLEGLESGQEYVAHLHEQSCGQDAGGPHFAFDPDGEAVPPNEIHLGVTANDAGAGEATVTNDRQVGERAQAVVVHPADASDNRLVCADF